MKVRCVPKKPLLAGAATRPGWPHLGRAAPLARTWGPVAVADPAGLLKAVWAVLSDLAGHDEVDAPFAGLGGRHSC